MAGTPKGLSDEKAARMIATFREGHTLRQFHEKAQRFKAYKTKRPPEGGQICRDYTLSWQD
jgi:hypothetical protein